MPRLTRAPAIQPITYPTLLPVSSYPLDTDPIHRFTKPSFPSVSIPGLSATFQLAEEAAPHVWPHNAEKIGMVRYIPKKDEEPPHTGSWLGFIRDDGEWEYVFTAFLYTHPSLQCEGCTRRATKCVQSFWDGPDPNTMKYPNPVTNSLCAHACIGCRTWHSDCSNKGVHILQPSLPKLEFDASLSQKMVKCTIKWKKPDAKTFVKLYRNIPGSSKGTKKRPSTGAQSVSKRGRVIKHLPSPQSDSEEQDASSSSGQGLFSDNRSVTHSTNTSITPKKPLDALLQSLSSENKSLRDKVAKHERVEAKLLEEAETELEKRGDLEEENAVLCKENTRLEKEVRRLRKVLLAMGSGDVFL